MDPEKRRQLLLFPLQRLLKRGALPDYDLVQRSFQSARVELQQLILDRMLVLENGRVRTTLEGLRSVEGDDVEAELLAAVQLLPILQDLFLAAPDEPVDTASLAASAGKTVVEVQRALTVLQDLPVWAGIDREDQTGLVKNMRLARPVLEASVDDLLRPRVVESVIDPPLRLIRRLEIDGYRPFSAFEATPDGLTVVIGANATGKTCLFDFLRFVGRAVQAPLPPEIDEVSVGKALFHDGGKERIYFAIELDLGFKLPLRYEAEVLGPVGAPRVAFERLASDPSGGVDGAEPYTFLEFRGGTGSVRGAGKGHDWSLKPNELALRRAITPNLVIPSRVQGLLASWRFYSGYNICSDHAIRRPVPSDTGAALDAGGGNLSAVLFWLQKEHPEVWEELEVHLASVPGFRSLDVKPRGGPGTVIGTWREFGLERELTLADLSDGTLRLLCWAVICLSPEPPPLLCLDEPDLGLHPRVLPVLAGLLRLASGRTQLMVATHSPYLLSHFKLDEIAVMRREDGAARFVRPSSSNALRKMVEEVGGDILARLHLSDELETLP